MRSPRFTLVGAAWAAFLVLFFVTAPRIVILSHLNDDAFYYYEIARNVADGHGISFDGLTPTNGFHPLYLGLLVPIFAPFHAGDFAPIRITLILLSLLFVGTGFLLYDVVRYLAGRRAAAWAGAAWFFNPLFLAFARGGVEAPLYTFLVALLVRQYVCRFRETPSLGRAVGLGWIAGLVVCARLDGALLVIAVVADFVLQAVRIRLPAGRVAALLAAGLIPAAIPLIPWIAWNLHTFGSLVQVSARAHAFAASAGRTIGGALGTLLGSRSPTIMASALAAGLALLLVILRAVKLLGAAFWSRIQAVLFLVIYLAVFFGIEFGWYRWWRNWYFLAPAMASLLLLAVLFLGWESAPPAPAGGRGAPSCPSGPPPRW